MPFPPSLLATHPIRPETGAPYRVREVGGWSILTDHQGVEVARLASPRQAAVALACLNRPVGGR